MKKVFINMEYDNLSFKYEAFGLKIHSEIELPELRPFVSEIADVIIYLDDVNTYRYKNY